jgi:hypothetical protein
LVSHLFLETRCSRRSCALSGLSLYAVESQIPASGLILILIGCGFLCSCLASIASTPRTMSTNQCSLSGAHRGYGSIQVDCTSSEVIRDLDRLRRSMLPNGNTINIRCPAQLLPDLEKPTESTCTWPSQPPDLRPEHSQRLSSLGFSCSVGASWTSKRLINSLSEREMGFRDTLSRYPIQRDWCKLQRGSKTHGAE